MLVSLILPTYKDIVALRLILDALELQTYKKFELLVVEDDDAQATKDFLHSYNSDFTIKHFFLQMREIEKPSLSTRHCPLLWVSILSSLMEILFRTQLL